MHKKRTGKASLWILVARRSISFFLAGVTLWILWLTADFRAVEQTLTSMGESTQLTMALLATELGEVGTDGMTIWQKLILNQSALLSTARKSISTLATQSEQMESPTVEVPSSSDSETENTSPPATTTAPDNIVEQTLTAGTSDRYVSTQGVYLYNYTDYAVDLGSLTLPTLDFTMDGPQILIIHTHTTEAYTPDGTDIYVPTGDARTTDYEYNIVRVGAEVAQVLRESGWSVVHDTEYYDYPAYDGAYSRSAVSIQRWLEQYPSIQIILDLHRDALVADDGTIYKTTAEIAGEKVAQVMMVVGSNAGGQTHDNWQSNLALAAQVQSQLNSDYPTLARPMILRSSRYNQQFLPGSMLVEIGSHGNTLQEVLSSARLFAQSLAVTLEKLKS